MRKYTQGVIRQGDILLIPLKNREISREISRQKLPHLTLATGELTGHSHRIHDGDARLYENQGIKYLQVLSSKATLIHEEHQALEIPKGNWIVMIQREYKSIKKQKSHKPFLKQINTVTQTNLETSQQKVNGKMEKQIPQRKQPFFSEANIINPSNSKISQQKVNNNFNNQNSPQNHILENHIFEDNINEKLQGLANQINSKYWNQKIREAENSKFYQDKLKQDENEFKSFKKKVKSRDNLEIEVLKNTFDYIPVPDKMIKRSSNYRDSLIISEASIRNNEDEEVNFNWERVI